MQSGSVVEATSSRLVPEQLLYDDLVGLSGCGDAEDSLDCLRHAPYESIITSFNGSQDGIGSMAAAFAGPSIDGSFLPAYGSVAYRSVGLASLRMLKVPVITGVVSNEGSNQIPGFVQNWTHLRDVLTDEHMYPSKVMDRLMSFYPPLAAGSDDNLDPPIKGLSISSRAELERIEQLMGDLAVNAGTRLMCETYAALSVCYSFRFDAMVSSVFDPRLGVRHGDEIGPVFQNFDGIGWDVNPFEGKGDGLRDMSRLIGIMWAGFITELDPNAGLSRDDPRWTRYSKTTRMQMVFNANGSLLKRDQRRPEALDYINTIQSTVFER
ncbi:hypothetical protein CHU98_g8257 [Xylaria longipes]|nr:hypothetical protein CHU98_g8257 [Xylaria longipes]